MLEKSYTNSNVGIGLTMGDPNGIGPEVLIRSLKKLYPFDGWYPIIFGDPEILQSVNQKLGTSFTYEILTKDERNVKFMNDSRCLPIIDLTVKQGKNWQPGTCSKWGGESAFTCVHQAIQWANRKDISAIVTAPLAKEAIQMAGHNFPGHTEILSHYSNKARSVMMLVVDDLYATMVTLHMSLKNVLATLSVKEIVEVMQITKDALQKLGFKNPILGLPGLNPHAGENGLFGEEEKTIIIPAMEIARKKGILCKGPFPPDTIFLEHRKGRLDAVVALYHDQALIPLKLIGFERAVNVTLGLPIIRTSPDHGTAFDLATKFEANPQSMIEAIKMAVRMAKNT